VGTVGVVQTFLPYPDFAASAVVLDRSRLGKQRVEALQILRALTREHYGWKHHPAVRMWAGYEEALACYAMEMCAEWMRRGHADSCAASISADLTVAGLPAPRSQSELAATRGLPPWLGDERLHRSHRAALVRKYPEHYRGRFDGVRTISPISGRYEVESCMSRCRVLQDLRTSKGLPMGAGRGPVGWGRSLSATVPVGNLAA
jgi:Pyrimidine dimer DNA glycosylase